MLYRVTYKAKLEHLNFCSSPHAKHIFQVSLDQPVTA